MAKNDKICNRFDQVLWAFLDGDMSEHHRIFWETHLKECDRCQSIRQEAHSLVLTYHELPDYETPETLLQDILGKAKSRNPLKRAIQHLKQNMPGKRIWKSSAIGAVVVVGGFILFNVIRQKRSV